MRALATPFLGACLLLSLPPAWGGNACPPPSIAGSPNALTTSRPASSAPSAAAKCKKPAATATAAAATPPVVVPSPAEAPVVAPSWKSVLDPLSAGGWAYISDGPPENPSAVYASTHDVLHDGNVVTAWIRWEFSRPQQEVYPLHYLSAVTREELDCDSRTYRRAAIFYYVRNNLQEKGPSFTALRDDTTWKQAIPGTEADAMLNWGCKPQSVKVKLEQPAAGKSATSKPAKAPAAAAASSAPAASSGPTDVHTAR